MFVVQAHSFTQQARLAITLAWVAGYTNILAFLTCGTVTSHVSGTTSNLGRDVVDGAHGHEGAWRLALLAAYLLVAFFLGAVMSGLATERARQRGWESIYVMPMALEAIFLALFALGVELYYRPWQAGEGPPISLVLLSGVAALAMGIQNATITRISSGVVRTTHVTGVLTDLGLEAAHIALFLREQPPGVRLRSLRNWMGRVRAHAPTWRALLLLSILGSFCFGSALGTLAFEYMPRWSMFPPVLFLAWIVYQDIVRPIAEIEESVLEREELGIDERIAIYHLRRDSREAGAAGEDAGAGRAPARSRRVQRMPNLLQWVERVPQHVRVVILDLGDVMQLDSNSALELRALLTRIRREQRELVISGIDAAQYEQLRRAGAGDLLDPYHVSPDLELAIARALNMLGDQGHPA